MEAKIEAQLFALQDETYREFHCRLIPTVDPETVIGVRVPALRKLANTLRAQPETAAFLQALPHRYYEENHLHGLLIAAIPEYTQLIAALNAFLPYIDNWATCDLLRPKAFRKHLPELLEQIRLWIRSEHPYTVRFGIEMLMTFYLEDDTFQPAYLELVCGVQSEEYYVKMMVAWYFATALAKQYDTALPYIEQRRLALWTHNKTIQKAVESYRITAEQKTYLKTLRQKRACSAQRG